jgi:FixJ family two-component response regulator
MTDFLAKPITRATLIKVLGKCTAERRQKLAGEEAADDETETEPASSADGTPGHSCD